MNQEKGEFTVHFWVLHEASRDSMVLSPGSQGSGSASQAVPFFTFMRRAINLDSDNVDLETKANGIMTETRVTE